MEKLTKAHAALHRMYGHADFSYCYASLKRGLHKDSAAYLRILAEQLELPADSYEIRLNEGGIAGSGEITLHSDNLYVQISQWAGYEDLRLLIRGCRSRKDCEGFANSTVVLQVDNAAEVLETCSMNVRIRDAQKELHDRLTRTSKDNPATKTVNIMVELSVVVPAHFGEDDTNAITLNIPIDDIEVYRGGRLLACAVVASYCTQAYYTDPD